LQVPETAQFDEVYENLEPRRRWGTAYFSRQDQLQLAFRDTEESLLVDMPEQLVLGRAHDGPPEDMPDVDLVDYGAVEKGVSRQHLLVTREDDTIAVTDLNSANGSFLNGQRLFPHDPRILRDEDELRLGRLVFQVSFV